MKDILTVAIIGLGCRGADSYGQIVNNDPRFNIVSLCEIRKVRLDRFQKEFNVKEEECFLDENEFFQKRRADVLVLATQDKDHVRHCLKALELGYDILLEKPITTNLEECYQLIAAQEKYGNKVIVCHVLRYAPAYCKMFELLNTGAIGKLVNIHAIEQVSYWHQAHSYVRGIWRREYETSPMIMAKCCHDLDLLQALAGSYFSSISSVGELTFFKKENQPEGAADKCHECQFEHTCPYSAYRIYVERWEKANKPASFWPTNVICLDPVLTKDRIIEDVKNHPMYNRCVFACDNDVVDHQETNIMFENGVSANLLMTAFTGECARHYYLHGTMGELDFDELNQYIILRKFGEAPVVYPFSALADINGGHGGGDQAIIEDVYQVCALDKPSKTTLRESLESHIMAIKAETSRKNKGKTIYRGE